MWDKKTKFPNLESTTGGEQLSSTAVTQNLFNDIVNSIIYLYRHLKKK